MQVAPDVHRVQIPVPFPLKFVNCYLVRGSDGWTVLDTGLQHGPCLNAWEEAFSRLMIRAEDIVRIVVTHLHPDHLGLAGWLQRRSGAPVYMLDREVEKWEQIWTPVQGEAQVNWFVQHGMPGAQSLQLQALHRQGMDFITPIPDYIRTVSHGDALPVGDRQFTVIWTPGHSDGQMILHNPETGILFSADHVLPHISPNVSSFPFMDPNPLHSYVRSLAAIRDLPARVVLPGHGEPIPSLAVRVDELLEHHQHRLEKVRGLVNGRSSAWDVACRLFSTDLTPHQQRFAVGEAIAHLEYLVGTGRLARQEDQGIVYSLN